MRPYNLMKGLNPQVVSERLSAWIEANKCNNTYYALTVTLPPEEHAQTSEAQALLIHDTIVKETLPHNRYFFSQEFTENGILHAHAVLTDFRGVKSFVNRIRRNIRIGYCQLKKVHNLQKWTEYLTKDVEETLLEFSSSDFNYYKYYNKTIQSSKMNFARLEKDLTNIFNILYFSQTSIIVTHVTDYIKV